MFRPNPECGSHCRLTAHSVSRLHHQASPTPNIAVLGYTSSAENSDSCGCRQKDCRAPFHYGNKLLILVAPTLNSDTAPTSRCRARLHISMSGNLRLLFRVVDAGLLLSLLHFTQCIFGCTRHSQASLPLLSLARKFTRTPYTSHVPPTHRGCSRLHSKPPAGIFR